MSPPSLLCLVALALFVKILVLSDLHLEFEPLAATRTDADVVVLAGDIHVGEAGIEWARESFPDRPVIYVLGNHEYYGGSLTALAPRLRAIAEGTNVHVLERDRCVIDGVAFLGCTLWTDFRLLGDLPKVAHQADERLSDFRRITLQPGGDPVTTADVSLLYQRSLRWLEEELLRRSGRLKKVVVTHHAPSMSSIATQDRGNPISAAYASSLDSFIKRAEPQLWIHGHIHNAQDYRIGKTRVVANPRGYPPSLNPRFNAEFHGGWCVEI